jgi:hypothetical protein
VLTNGDLSGCSGPDGVAELGRGRDVPADRQRGWCAGTYACTERHTELKAIVDAEPVHERPENVRDGSGTDPKSDGSTGIGVPCKQQRNELALSLVERKLDWLARRSRSACPWMR